MTNNNASALPTPSDLDECAAMTVADALKIILANSYAIYLKTKNFHTIFDRHMGGAASPKQVRRIQHQQPQVPDWNAPHESGRDP